MQSWGCESRNIAERVARSENEEIKSVICPDGENTATQESQDPIIRLDYGCTTEIQGAAR